MGDKHISHLVDKSSDIYLIWTKNNQYPIYWSGSKDTSFMLLAQVLSAFSGFNTKRSLIHSFAYISVL